MAWTPLLAILLLCLVETPVASLPDLLNIDVLSAGGSYQDEISLLHVDAGNQYVVGRFNGDDEGQLSGVPTTSNVQIESSAGASLQRQEAPIDAVFIAKLSNGLEELEWLHGPFTCSGNGSDAAMNCTQHLDDADVVLALVTGLTVVNGNVILSGCQGLGTANGCANVVSPGKWSLEATGSTCANTQGGLVSHADSIFMAGTFQGALSFKLRDQAGNVLEEFPGGNSLDAAPYVVEMNASGHVINLSTNDGQRDPLTWTPLFMATTPKETARGDARVAVLSRLHPPSNRCLLKRNVEAFHNEPIALTDLSFSGQPNVLFHLSDQQGLFEATGIARGQDVAYISGYLRGSLQMPSSCTVSTSETGDQLTHTDGLLIKVDMAAPRVEWVLRMGGPGQDRVHGVAARGGDVYVAGTFETTFDVKGLIYTQTEGGGCTYVEVSLNMPEVQSKGELDIFVMKLTSSEALDVQWVTTAVGPKDSVVSAIAVDPGDRLHVAGRFEGSLQLPSSPQMQSRGLFDAFVATFQQSEDVALAAPAPPTPTASSARGSPGWRAAGTAVLVTLCVAFTAVGLGAAERWRRFRRRKRDEVQLEDGGDDADEGRALRVMPTYSYVSGCEDE